MQACPRVVRSQSQTERGAAESESTRRIDGGWGLEQKPQLRV